MESKIKEFKNLEKWQGTLANCIRCGYCFEHCPMFKHTGWESDAPRAKIITAFGLLNGEVEPSESSAKKMFSCFYCKRCEAACSSGVALTDVFTDAKKDLVEMGLDGPGTTSITKLNCARCLVCLEACPHDARSYKDEKITTDPAKCQSCGICLEVCPAGAAQIENSFGTDREELVERAAQFLTTHDAAHSIVFACNWSYHPELQASVLPDSETKDDRYEILVNMCGGRLDPRLLMAPFLHNARGILIACCPDGDCQHDGNKKAKMLVNNLKKTFEKLEMNPDRIGLVEIPAGDKDLFQAEIDTFVDQMNQMGPIR